MSRLSAEMLPLVQRLALTYAPVSARETILTLLLLDNRLASILQQRGEAMIAQIKLAWWRDRLGENPESWPQGEPLLARLSSLPFAPASLGPLVDGWEVLLAEELSPAGLHEFAKGRVLVWSQLADGAEVSRAAGQWALADLAINLGEGEERDRVQRMALDYPGEAQATTQPLPRKLRSLAVLHRLTLRALEKGSREVLDGPAAGLLALRIGLTGR
ncbi:hypothetical protein [Alteraurantiacibacter aquimixticola]|nr:hypothetical protein [Alteraurantiacibacter aquimixticola]